MKINIFFSFVLLLTCSVYAQNHPNYLLEIHYDGDYANAIGSANTDFIIAAKFTQDNLTPFVGDAISQIRVYINNPTKWNVGIVKIFGGGTPSAAGDLIYSSSEVHVNPYSWNSYPIPVLVTIPASDLWIAFEATSGPTGSHSWAGCDSGPNDPDGQYIYFGGSWRPLTALGASFTYNWNIRAVIETVTQVEPITLPKIAILEQNYPNPFNPNTTIKYSVSHDSWVNIKVYNSLGQEVSVLLNKRTSPGDYSLNFNAGNLPSGIYLYKLTAVGINGSTFSSVKKMLFAK